MVERLASVSLYLHRFFIASLPFWFFHLAMKRPPPPSQCALVPRHHTKHPIRDSSFACLISQSFSFVPRSRFNLPSSSWLSITLLSTLVLVVFGRSFEDRAPPTTKRRLVHTVLDLLVLLQAVYRAGEGNGRFDASLLRSVQTFSIKLAFTM